MYSIIPFTSEIIGASNNIRSVFIIEKNLKTNEDVVLQVSKKDFMNMVELWIEKKGEYCDKFDRFCGIMGDFSVEKSEKIGDVELLQTVNFDEDENSFEIKYESLPVIVVKKWDTFCDMEHG